MRSAGAGRGGKPFRLIVAESSIKPHVNRTARIEFARRDVTP